jgi:hypothetical protein
MPDSPAMSPLILFKNSDFNGCDLQNGGPPLIAELPLVFQKLGKRKAPRDVQAAGSGDPA